MNLRALVPFGEGRTLMRTESNPFGTLQREVDRLFDEFVRGVAGTNGSLLMPSTDVVETDKAFEISIELPGLERNDIDISADDGNLVIRGEKKAETEKKDNNYHIAERSYGMFYRSVPLPAGVDPEAIQATMSKGVLKITIPKPAHSQAKKIEVKEAA